MITISKNRFPKNIIDVLAVAFVAALAFFPAAPLKAQDDVQKNQMKFGRLLRLVDGYYVDSANVNDLTEKAIVHMLSELDPHSVYISKEEVDKMNEPLQGNFEGIGISFNIFKDTLLITSIIPGGPSEKVGLRAGDRILQVDGKNIAGTGLKNSDVMGMLRGDKGTTVELSVLRRNLDEMLDFTIIRDKIPIFSLDASYMLDDKTGYIKLNKFSATTTEEFTKAMVELKGQNLQNLILDLRGNGGGYLKTAIEISGQFLNANKLIVYTDGLHEPRRDYKASSGGIFKNGNLVVLVDESSASASEIVSGAIQDWDRGLIIGRRSFGKGLVQKPYFLTDGSLVRLTTAHYYTPSGRNIQKPYEHGVEEYKRDYLDRLSSGELFNADSIHLSDSLKFKTLLNGRNVYGGGGVMPDIFIPMDTSAYYRYYNRLRRTNVVYNFVLDYVDLHRADLKKQYPKFEKFNSKFEVTQNMIDSIVAQGEKDGVEKDEESLDFTIKTMKNDIKALIARDLFSINDYFKILFKEDEAILKALEVIENKERYNNLLVSVE
ncbi:C-terminal processing peptidase-3. Serine peptidase. MEROPS family S41A [Mariniphaga anaerophila]|uniref:C-terminal processing peptidase-3. Serine peptidase. MEROPS family S41A n=1 Tax=Mariniphaga anaerophila TaxID=1484053 RepID=A0A1M5EUX5_9BACT|nr:S41 family peptidase [Mariniphaga anaerophila]SHF83055.1 C-terminal processing peptidase-3. Serine peptidase. MEROPS family S41A [Mariniphaga anaerophila]